ncbi:MAG: DUF434 domain-containing protein [Clostridium sp.]|jgi:hypothetical protein|uniref:DUF434 domain-containing protein n=1 Tax=Clostridium sp. TaxID=1506 RepID=UPI0025B9A809|nr:DUF434 domain-containing protein [Clostridium sp.]MCH3965909.1 DUF434 domain-containing protein [Clostridium sp.]MCI1716002.1 DUF434 domain-containing protein [Clostridium sp.]MCI1800326.1 DUF434 domain-containing protein [Clostridium sp.]MCI1814179.1 DUF434 domain-containing protein [Clostridium sp.]MCI1871078.1 DUF434 domain-containing protein [Clostridium sp.]
MGNSRMKSVKRGCDPQDDRWFSKEALLRMQKAQEEIQWLLDRNYNSHSIIEMVGNHYQFSARQRNALIRSTASSKKIEARRAKCIFPDLTNTDLIYIDGFNLIITLETAFSGSPIILCSDGAVRDLAGLRGTYRIIDKTGYAMNTIGKELDDVHISHVIFLLDRGVSNSGRLRKFILENSENWNINVEVRLMDSVDCFLYKKYCVVTSDSIIIDECYSWYNLARKIIQDYIPHANIINLCGSFK